MEFLGYFGPVFEPLTFLVQKVVDKLFLVEFEISIVQHDNINAKERQWLRLG